MAGGKRDGFGEGRTPARGGKEENKKRKVISLVQKTRHDLVLVCSIDKTAHFTKNAAKEKIQRGFEAWGGKSLPYCRVGC